MRTSDHISRAWLIFSVTLCICLSSVVAAAPLGPHLTAPIQTLCERILIKNQVFVGKPGITAQVQVESAERLAAEIRKESPNIPQIIEDLIHITPPPSIGVEFAKRAVDISVGTLGLVLTSPLYPLIAAAIKIDSYFTARTTQSMWKSLKSAWKAPVFYQQVRSGRLPVVEGSSQDVAELLKDADFKMYKFRTMRVDAEKFTGVVIATKNDPRVTRVGAFLRDKRLDELPQFLNVIKGQMSIVGARPERRELILQIRQAVPLFPERMRHMKPGITGFAQVSVSYSGAETNGAPKNEFEGFENKLLYDLIYQTKGTKVTEFLFTEMWIIIKTPYTMVRGVKY